MKYIERLMWATIVVAIVYVASTDPWFSWPWFLFFALCGIVIGLLCYQWGLREGNIRGRAKGYEMGKRERKKWTA